MDLKERKKNYGVYLTRGYPTPTKELTLMSKNKQTNKNFYSRINMVKFPQITLTLDGRHLTNICLTPVLVESTTLTVLY